MKTHNAVVATLSVKNSRWARRCTIRRGEILERQAEVSRGRAAEPLQHAANRAKLQPNWGATVIDGFEGMEGDGPNSGNPCLPISRLPQRITLRRIAWGWKP